MSKDMHDRIFVYCAGPYTNGDTEYNVNKAVDIGNRVRDLGCKFVPIVPHLFHFWHDRHERGYEDWMDLDFGLLTRCDALIRFGGESPGGDREVAFCQGAGIPVYESVQELELACTNGNASGPYYVKPEVKP